ncbi:MAG: hypothetical protein EAZ13_10790 [Sphingobacteriia bacterium]|nr:MAG: hypothetical protein EAZ13_10790 [Sphingobacteriia bacterium]
MRQFLNQLFKVFLSLFYLSIFFNTNAQTYHPNAIKKIIEGASPDSIGVHQLNNLSEILADKDAEQSLQLAKKALELAETLQLKRHKGIALNHICIAYYRKGDFTNAFTFGIKALRWNESIFYPPQIALAYKNIGAVYHSQFNYKLAIEFLKKALDIQTKLHNKKEVGRALNNIASSALDNRDTSLAKAYILSSLAHNKALKDYYQLALAYRTAGDIADHMRQIDSAEFFYKSALLMAQKANSDFMKEASLYRLAKLCYNRKAFTMSIRYSNEALVFSKKLGAKSETAEIYKLESLALEGIGDYKKALFAHKEFSNLYSLMHQEKKIKQLAEMEAEFGLELKQEQINNLEIEKAGRVVQQNRYTVLIFCLAMMMIAVLIMLFIIWRKDKSKQAINTELNEQKKSLEEILVLKDKIFSIISHDLRGPIASLSAVLPMLEPESLDYDSYAALKNNLSKQVKSLNLTLENLLIWARTQMKGKTLPNKKPLMLGELVDRNMDILLSMADQKQIQLTNSIPENCIVFADMHQLDIIIRNLLLNAVKFTNKGGFVIAKSVENNETIVLTITDNGIGMSEIQVSQLFQLKTHFTTQGTRNEKGIGLGLLVCAEYANDNNCILKVESEQGEGTIISLILPKA